MQALTTRASRLRQYHVGQILLKSRPTMLLFSRICRAAMTRCERIYTSLSAQGPSHERRAGIAYHTAWQARKHAMSKADIFPYVDVVPLQDEKCISSALCQAIHEMSRKPSGLLLSLATSLHSLTSNTAIPYHIETTIFGEIFRNTSFSISNHFTLVKEHRDEILKCIDFLS